MTLDVRTTAFDEAWCELTTVVSGTLDLVDDQTAEESATDSEAVEAVANALDRMREVCACLGQMTLRAQVSGLASEQICAALDTVTAAGVRALTELLDAA